MLLLLPPGDLGLHGVKQQPKVMGLDLEIFEVGSELGVVYVDPGIEPDVPVLFGFLLAQALREIRVALDQRLSFAVPSRLLMQPFQDLAGVLQEPLDVPPHEVLDPLGAYVGRVAPRRLRLVLGPGVVADVVVADLAVAARGMANEGRAAHRTPDEPREEVAAVGRPSALALVLGET